MEPPCPTAAGRTASLLPHASDGERGRKQMRLDIPACPLVAVITTVVIVNNGGDNVRCFVPALSRLFVVFSFLCLPSRQPPPLPPPSPAVIAVVVVAAAAAAQTKQVLLADLPPPLPQLQLKRSMFLSLRVARRYCFAPVLN